MKGCLRNSSWSPDQPELQETKKREGSGEKEEREKEKGEKRGGEGKGREGKVFSLSSGPPSSLLLSTHILGNLV